MKKAVVATLNAGNIQSAQELFNSIVGEAKATRTRSPLELRTVGGQEYFRSCYSRRWFKTSDRAGEHKYSKADIKIWNQIYNAVKPVQKTIEQLRAAGDAEAADKLYKESEARGLWKLWSMKDNTPELYANTGGLTDDELDALEQDSK